MSERAPIVYIVDDDPLTCRYFEAVLSAANVTCYWAESALSFLERYDPNQSGCLLLDVQMPGMSGPALQRELNMRGAVIPVIFVSSHSEVPTAVDAMLHGAFDFLQKPVSPQTLLLRVRNALDYDAGNRAVLKERDQTIARLAMLTPRERDVFSGLIAGRANKVIAGDLRLSERTVELYRARVMEKTGSRSLAHLVRMAMQVEATPLSQQRPAAVRANQQ